MRATVDWNNGSGDPGGAAYLSVDQHNGRVVFTAKPMHGSFALKTLIVTIGLFLSVVLYTGWIINDACSTYRGTFRPADMVCDIPYGRELEITMLERSPQRGMAAEQAGQAADHSICRTSSNAMWQLACDIPSDRELIFSLSPSRFPRVRCKLFVDCPVRY
jgi:hypothetical protein